MNNTWPNGHRHAMSQDEHEQWNSSHYPGTRQLCTNCGEPTGRCEEDALYAEGGVGPFCESCWDDVCGLCGLPGADKVAHPVRWPGEQDPGTPYVHADCETAECRRAHAALTDEERRSFIRGL